VTGISNDVNVVPAFSGLHSNACDLSAYGYTAVQAYQLYNDSQFLKYGQAAWAFAEEYTVSRAQATSGHLPSKNNFTIKSECDSSELVLSPARNPCELRSCRSATMAGGTFYVNSTRKFRLQTSHFFLAIGYGSLRIPKSPR
jgi:hypothetical protein